MNNDSTSLHKISLLSEVSVSDSLKLLPLNESHGDRILEILSKDSSIRDRVTVASRLHSLEDVRKEIDFYKSCDGLIRYTLLKDNNPVGMVSFWRDDGFWGDKNLDDYGFGYFLDPKERGQGLVTRAIKGLIKVASKALYVRQFVAFCEDDNQASISVLKKLRFKSTNETFSEPSKGWVERKYIF